MTNDKSRTFCVWEKALLFVVVFIFAVGTSILSWDNWRAENLVPRFHWPDETSNAYFADRIAHNESLAIPESRNTVAGNLIHPRTVNVRSDGALVSGSYLGLPLWYGFIGRVMGTRTMLFMTPLLAALGLWALAMIVRRFFGTLTALLATALLALHPSVWFFTATAFLPNVPFVALLLMGFAVMLHHSSSRGEAEGSHINVRLPRCVRFLASLGMTRRGIGMTRRGITRWFVGGLLLGFALTLRTHELLWVGALVIGVAVWQRPGWRAIASGVFGAALPFIPIFILNAQLYGNPFTTGYALLNEGGALPTEFIGAAAAWLPASFRALIPSEAMSILAGLFAPFGWHPRAALIRFWTYGIVPYPWFIALAAVGLAVGWRAGRRIAVTVTVALIGWLVLYYGSWTIADPLVRQLNILTISYVRYWLPITVALAFWAAVGFQALLNFSPRRSRLVIAAVALLVIAVSSAFCVLGDPVEGLQRQRQALFEHRERAQAVIKTTESDAVIVSHRFDKAFFPERAVIHAPVDPAIDADFLARLRRLIDVAPVYWYATGDVAASGFILADTGRAPFGEKLYRVCPAVQLRTLTPTICEFPTQATK
ncbi:MAG: hypothetical protein V1723_03405 [Candidatus Uhrbacteria bacterium]